MMQTQKEMSKISVRPLCEVTEAYPDTNFSSLPSPIRGFRRKSSHRETRSRKSDHLIRFAYNGRVNPLVKLLALTSIPPLRKNKVSIDNTKRSTVNASLEQISVSEKEYDFSTEGSPLDIFLSLQDELNKKDDLTRNQEIIQNNTLPRILSTTNHFTKTIAAHFQSPLSATTSLETLKSASDQGTKLRRKPFYSPRQPCVYEDHPLFPVKSFSYNVDQEKSPNKPEQTNEISGPQHLRARSQLALRHKLKKSLNKIKLVSNSFSSQISSPLVPINPSRPTKFFNSDTTSHTSERLPINLEYVPTSQLRWYLNPITNAPIEEYPSTHSRTKRQRRCLVSIQMQTYKISASNEHSPRHIISYRTKPSYEDQSAKEIVFRRRDMRENSDFLRVAVMEMLMRRRGKLDNQGLGKARSVLPPRTLTTRPPEITAGGIPVRWISLPV